jgi:hypothetical protein
VPDGGIQTGVSALIFGLLGADRHTRILTLKTPDGFKVSFAVSEDQYRRIKRGQSHGAEVPERKVN